MGKGHKKHPRVCVVYRPAFHKSHGEGHVALFRVRSECINTAVEFFMKELPPELHIPKLADWGARGSAGFLFGFEDHPHLQDVKAHGLPWIPWWGSEQNGPVEEFLRQNLLSCFPAEQQQAKAA